MSAATTRKDERKLEKTSQPSIYRRGNRYVFVYRGPDGRNHKRFAPTFKAAKALKESTRTDIRRGEYRELSRVTFREYAPRWLETYKGRTRRGVGETTRADYRDAIERDAIPFFGRQRLAEVQPQHVREFITRLERRLAPASVRKTVAPVRALFATALEDGLIRSNPAAGLRVSAPVDDPEAERDEKAKALTEDELRRVLAELTETWRFFFSFLAQTGLRIGEAIEVRYRDLDGGLLRVDRQWYRGRVTSPKGRKRRAAKLPPELVRALIVRRDASGAGEDDLIFTAERGGRIIPRNLMGRVLKPAAVRAGFGEWVEVDGRLRPDTWIGHHTFRHTCATLLFRGGWNAEHVSQYLGHTDAGFTTRTYVHLLPDDLPTPRFGTWDGPPDSPLDDAGQLVGETTPSDAAPQRLALVAAR